MPRQLNTSRVRELLDYNPDNGELTWRLQTSRRVKVGDVAGSAHNQGYITVGIDGVRWLTHHVVWVWWYGEMPDGDVDHINRDRSDNRISNLRCVSRSDNLLNARHKNATGFTGVMQVPNGRFRAAFHVKRKCTYIGTYDTAEEAHEAYAKRHIQEYGVRSKFHPDHVNPMQ